MGRGLGPTQQKVLDFLDQRWRHPAFPELGPMVPQAAVPDALATSYSEAQAIRRAIRTLKDRKLIGISYMQSENDVWLVPPRDDNDWGDPRPRKEWKLAALREAITENLTHDWQEVQLIRRAVMGDRPGKEQKWEGSHEWDRQRQRFNRALRQLCPPSAAVAVTRGMTHGCLQRGWLVRLLTEQERDSLAEFVPQ